MLAILPWTVRSLLGLRASIEAKTCQKDEQPLGWKLRKNPHESMEMNVDISGL